MFQHGATTGKKGSFWRIALPKKLRRSFAISPRKKIGLWIQKGKLHLQMSNHWCSGTMLVSGIPWWDDMMLEMISMQETDDYKCNVCTNVDCWECKVNLPQKAVFDLCCDAWSTSTYSTHILEHPFPTFHLGEDSHGAPVPLKISGVSFFSTMLISPQVPETKELKCRSAEHCPMEWFLIRQFNHQTWNLI